MVAALDDFIGNTTKALKNNGLWSQTLLVVRVHTHPPTPAHR